MERNRKLFLAKTAVVLCAIPAAILAYEYGPDAGHSGVPGELGTCAQAGCHVGTANDPNNKGSVSVTFPNGMTYTPGVKQHLTVTIADPATTQKAWGFQLTARSSSSTTAQAGAFASTDNNTLVMCASANLGAQTPLSFGASQICALSTPLTYIEHSLAGYTAGRGQTGSGTYQFDWTPPATSVGNITIYVAGNAANGDLTVNGDHIYTTTYTLTPAAATPLPAITGVINGAGFQSAIEAGSWVAIQGTNLANTNPGRTWRADEIVNGQLPTSLDGVSVTINGKNAFVYYISPTQINVQAPSDTALGTVSVVVNNNGSISPAGTATLQNFAPACFMFGGTYCITTRYPDNALVGNPSTISGTVAAKPGDILILWATGFGATNPAVPGGQVVTGAPAATTAPSITVGGVPVSVISSVLSPGSAGLYQVAIQLPTSVPLGDQPLVATVGGVQSPSAKLFIAAP